MAANEKCGTFDLRPILFRFNLKLLNFMGLA